MSPARPQNAIAQSGWHMLVRTSQDDRLPAVRGSADHTLELTIDMAGAGRGLSHTVWRALDDHGYRPPTPSIDLYRIAAAVFSADLRLPRAAAFDRWTRDITLYLPVSNIGLWEGVRTELVDLFSFLTGDHWDLVFYKTKATRPAARPRRSSSPQMMKVDAACLLSGGLDSFIGASDAFAAGRRLALVSHHSGGSAVAAGPAQEAIVNAIAKRYGKDKLQHLQMSVTPPKKGFTDESEETTRSRSIIFLALGVLVAAALPVGARHLIVPENGLISLNVPLTYSRLGSLSTKTTHPHTIALFRRVLAGVGLNVGIENPYQVTTKGEMLQRAADKDFVKAELRHTVSCARPTSSRWAGGSPNKHCGRCVPCIIRRAAIESVWDDPTGYDLDIRKVAGATPAQRDDVFAFRVAIERMRTKPWLPEVLGTGPLNESSVPIKDYVDVFRRGLAEVGAFLLARPRKRSRS